MTKTDTANERWGRELSTLSRRLDGRRELRQFHTAAGTARQRVATPNRLSKASTAALAVGNGAVMGGLLGSLFGVTAGVAAGAVVALVGYLWVSGSESRDA
jgi:hypothetical protein